MAAVPFSVHPRRIVRRPDGTPAMVGIRRNLDRPHGWTTFGRIDRDSDWTRRLLRRDRSWLVELYDGMAEDPTEIPRRSADRYWVVTDRPAAEARAEEVCTAVQRGERPFFPPPPA